jgi:hypothetical protein
MSAAPARLAVAAVLALALAPSGCGGGDDAPAPDPADERADAPVAAPAGWRTLVNRTAGFSVAIPPGWTARKRRTATLIRSGDRLLALTLAADRSRSGRETGAAEYARRTLTGLPSFDGPPPHAVGRVRGSPYESAQVESTGRLATSARPQRVSVAVLQRPGQVTYTAVAFRNARVRPHLHDRTLGRLLATFRARPPAL